MVRADLRDELHGQVQRSIAAGATPLVGCTPGQGASHYPASILDHVVPGMPAYSEELFGPVASVIRVSDDAQAVQPKARHAVMFAATIPGSIEGRYGLALAGNSSWSWSGGVIISSARTVSEFHAAAAELGIEVVEGYAGMVFTSRKNAVGAVVTEQRQAFDWTDF